MADLSLRSTIIKQHFSRISQTQVEKYTDADFAGINVFVSGAMSFREEIRRVEVFLLLQEENGPAQQPKTIFAGFKGQRWAFLLLPHKGE